MVQPVKGGNFKYFTWSIDEQTNKPVKDMNLKISTPEPNESSAIIKDGNSTEQRRTNGGYDMTKGFRFTRRQAIIFEHICGLDGNPNDLSPTDLEALKKKNGMVKIDAYNQYKASCDDQGRITVTVYDDRTKQDANGAVINFEVLM